MPQLTFAISQDLPTDAETVRVIGVRSTDEGPSPLATDVDASLPAALGLKGKPGEFARGQWNGARVAFVGLGESPDADAVRSAAGVAARRISDATTLALDFGEVDGATGYAALEGAGLGAYRITKVTAKDQDAGASTFVLRGTGQVPPALSASVAAVAFAKDLGNTPPNELSPAALAARARVAGDAVGVTVTELDEHALAERGFGGILAVGQGSSRPPRLIVAEWRPEEATQHIALVGKGITFDTGGLSLKPSSSMQHMKFDMCGAADVLAATLAVAAIGTPVRVTAFLCTAENMPSGTAIRPDDVITMYGGTTVEVTNTDAEGRLVLADGLVAASELGPDAIIDVATLTGAQRVALGNRTAGVFGDDALVQALRDAGARVGERLWPMPITDEQRARIDSTVADLRNAKVGDPAGGMLLAAAFLREFVGERDGVTIPWAHLDIAGPSVNNEPPFGHQGPGATGFSVRSLIALLTSLA